MVPMRMRNEKGQLDGLLLKLFRQSQPERPDAGPCVQDDNFPVRANLYAGSVAPVDNSRRAWSWNRSAHTPKLDFCSFVPSRSAGFHREKIAAWGIGHETAEFVQVHRFDQV